MQWPTKTQERIWGLSYCHILEVVNGFTLATLNRLRQSTPEAQGLLRPLTQLMLLLKPQPGKPVAHNLGPLCLNNELLWGIVAHNLGTLCLHGLPWGILACQCGLLGFPGQPESRPDRSRALRVPPPLRGARLQARCAALSGLPHIICTYIHIYIYMCIYIYTYMGS